MKQVMTAILGSVLLVIVGCATTGQGGDSENTEQPIVSETVIPATNTRPSSTVQAMTATPTPTTSSIGELMEAALVFTPLPTTRQPASNTVPIVLTIITRGGLCVYGACFQTVTVQEDGNFSVVIGQDTQSIQTGLLDSDLIQTMQQEIDQTDFAAIRAVPFADECPTAYDGSEFIYTFHTRDGLEEISSCEYVIEAAHPLFQIVYRVQGLIVEQSR